MQLALILLLLFIFALADAFIYTHIKNRAEQGIQALDKKKETLLTQHKELDDEVNKLRREHTRLQGRYNLLKQEMRSEPQPSQQKSSLTPEDILLQEELITSEQLEKAQSYIQRNHSPLSLLDALILLNIIDLDTANYVKAKHQPQR